jgi:hypothetical protein
LHLLFCICCFAPAVLHLLCCGSSCNHRITASSPAPSRPEPLLHPPIALCKQRLKFLSKQDVALPISRARAVGVARSDPSAAKLVTAALLSTRTTSRLF